jgi:quinol monooxygenase YgiN
MYGTIAKLTVRPGQAGALKELFAGIAKHPGLVASYLFQADSDANTLYLVAISENKAAYRANADRPETDADYKKWVRLLAAEPEWHDGEVRRFE